jgi:hypothetical protein
VHQHQGAVALAAEFVRSEAPFASMKSIADSRFLFLTSANAQQRTLCAVGNSLVLMSRPLSAEFGRAAGQQLPVRSLLLPVHQDVEVGGALLASGIDSASPSQVKRTIADGANDADRWVLCTPATATSICRWSRWR